MKSVALNRSKIRASIAQQSDAGAAIGECTVHEVTLLSLIHIMCTYSGRIRADIWRRKASAANTAVPA